MKPLALLFTLFIFGILGCEPSSSDSDFNINEQWKTSLGNNGAEEFLYWDIDEDTSLWSLEIGEVNGIESFRDSLKLLLGDAKYEAVINKESTQKLDKDLLLGETDGDKINALLIHTGTIGHVRPINTLEAHILNYQLVKYPFIGHPTEFHGFIAYNAAKKSYRVYFGASDQPWPPHPDLLLDQLDEDVKNGWQLKYHLHNHYEPASNNYLGILAPSMADAQYFKMLSEQYNVEAALITNGLYTVEIPSEDFTTFESH